MVSLKESGKEIVDSTLGGCKAQFVNELKGVLSKVMM